MSGQNARRSIAERRAAHETAFFEKIKFNLRFFLPSVYTGFTWTNNGTLCLKKMKLLCWPSHD